MKVKHRALAILLSAIMVLTFMPAMAFAEGGEADEPTLELAATGFTSVSCESETAPTGYIGTDYANLDVIGAKITLGYPGNKTEVYEYLPEVVDEETGDWHSEGWYLNGDYENGRETELNRNVVINGRLKEGVNECVFYVFDENREEDVYGNTIKVIGVQNEEIESVTYNHVGGALEGRANSYDKKIEYLWDTDDGEDDFDNSRRELEGDSITINYVDREPETYTCRETTDEDGRTSFVFSREYTDEESGETYYNEIWPNFYDNQVEGEWTWLGQEFGYLEIFVDGAVADTKLQVKVPEVKALKSAELVLTDGFEPKVSVGNNDWISRDAFAGEGNKLVVSYTDGSTREFVYNPDWEEFVDEDGNEADFGASLEDQEITLKKGVETPVVFTYWEEDYENDFYDSVEFTVPITATKAAIELNWGGAFQYNGKVKKPTVKVTTVYGGATVPASAYTVYYPEGNTKAIGEYYFYIKLKNTNDYFVEDNYDDTQAWGWYQIIPKKPTAKKASSGKKRFTAKWKKFSKKDQKNIDGFYIEYSLDKHFDDSKFVKAKKKASSKVIKKLKGKKTYYYRVYSYKKCKYTYYDENGVKRTATYEVWSNPSKAKKVKTKK